MAIREKICGVREGADDETLALELKNQNCPAEVIDEFWTTLRRIRRDDYRELQINPGMMKEMLDGFGGCEPFTGPTWSERNP